MRHAALLSDEPLNAGELAQTDASRLRPLIDALYAHLEQLVFHDPLQVAAGRGVAVRIGLFGGLGQGKSTVVRAVLDRLDRRLRDFPLCWAWDRLLGRRVLVFDASHYQAADLEWRFFEAVLARRINRNRGIFWLPALLLLLAWASARWWSADGQAGLALQLPAIAAAFAAALPLLKPALDQWGAARKSRWGAGLGYTQRDLTAAWMAKAVGALPKVVVIDDLDRSSVDQQRAVLRAARRYSQLLGFGFVVSMDDTALLASPANPELPEELLRKVVQVEFRVPDRGAEDCVLLAASALRSLAHCNPRHAPLLLQPLVVADLARLLSLWPGTISPRLVKRLVNDMWSQIHALGALRADMLVASLRLHTLWQAVPSLRLHPDSLRVALENNRLEHFQRLVDHDELGLPPERRPALLQLLARTRALQPERGYGWHHLVSNLSCGPGFAHISPSPGMLDEPPQWSFWPSTNGGLQPALGGEPGRILRYVSELIDGTLLSAGRTSGRYVWDVPAPLAGGSFAPPTLPGLSHRRLEGQQPGDATLIPELWLQHPAEYHAHVWALWVARLARMSVQQRGLAYQKLESAWLDQVSPRPAAAPHRREPFGEACEHWIERECTADAEHWALQSTAGRAAWLAQLKQPALAWLMHLQPRDMVHGLRALQAIGQREEELAAARWTQPLRCPDPPGQGTGATDVIKWDMLQDVLWPQPLPPQPGRAAWVQVLRAHTEYWVLLRHGGEGLPAGMVEAWKQAHDDLTAEDRLHLFSVAYGCDGTELADQRLGRLYTFTDAVHKAGLPATSYVASLHAAGASESTQAGPGVSSATLERPVLAVLADLAQISRMASDWTDLGLAVLRAPPHQARLATDFPAWCADGRFAQILANEAAVSLPLMMALAGPAVTAQAPLLTGGGVSTSKPFWLHRFRAIIEHRDDALQIEVELGL